MLYVRYDRMLPCATLVDSIHLKQALEDIWGQRVDVEPDRLIRNDILAEERIIYVAPS